MSERLSGVIVAHADMADALLAAVRSIVGDETGLVAVSNRGCDRQGLTRKIEAALAQGGGGPALVFADLAGGSCAHIAAALAHLRADLRVVTGVNLAMLVDFVFHRDLPVAEAAERAAQTGRNAVAVVGATAARGGAGAGAGAGAKGPGGAAA